MIAFHLILSAYGFWLSNDPRGSWSDFVGAWELARFGPATKVSDQRSYAKDAHDVALRRRAREFLKYPPVRFDDAQRAAIASGFASACDDANYVSRACSIGFDHAHLVFDAHPRSITVIAGHLKSHATRELTRRAIHPLSHLAQPGSTLPTPWSEGCWKVYIDSDDHLRTAISYVERHAEKECLPSQHWPFVRP